jgi:ABC-type bacteriocin/lantibiotic exporter with double-glycine peptidase domain
MNYFQFQQSQMDCGPTCLHMVQRFHGGNYSYNQILAQSELDKNGTNFFGLSTTAESIASYLSTHEYFSSAIRDLWHTNLYAPTQNPILYYFPDSIACLISLGDH